MYARYRSAEQRMHLFVVDIAPSADVAQVVLDATAAIKTAKDGGVEMLHSFKVAGENKLVAVVKGDVDKLLNEVNTKVGQHARTTSSPLRAYEDFAKHVLKLEPDQHNGTLRSGLTTLWLHFVVEYPGKSLKQLIETWSNEANTVFAGRKAGHLDIQLFKVCAQREVHAFVTTTEMGAIDDASFGLPLMVENGDNVRIHTKEVKAI